MLTKKGARALITMAAQRAQCSWYMQSQLVCVCLLGGPKNFKGPQSQDARCRAAAEGSMNERNLAC